jgi:multidrug efflux pump subunit AcrA (membrane-fusion protein)
MFLLLTVVPISHTTHAFGIVEGSQDRIVRAESNGFLVESRFGEGDRIVKRQLLARLENPEIDSLVLQHDSVTRAMETELFDRIKNRDPSEAANAQQRLKSSRQQLEQYKRSQNGLDVRAPVTGRIVDSTVLKETGKFLRKGDFVTRVSAGATVLRVTMTEQDYSDTHPVVGDEVILRFAATDGFSMIGRIQSVGRSGSNEIDEPRLTQLAGGDIPVDPNTMRAKSSYFELKIVPVGPVPDQVRHGMSGVAELNGDHRSLGIDLYRLALRFIHKLRMES